MSVISAPELDVHTKKRKRDEEQPLILRQPTPRAPTVFAPVPTSRVIDPPTPFSLRRRAESAKPSPTVDQAVQSPRSDSPGSAAAPPPLDEDEDEDDAREPFAPPDEEEDNDAPPPFAPPPDEAEDAQEPFAPQPYDGQEEYDDEEEDEEDYDDEQDAADEFERVAREVLDDPSFGALAAILEGRDAAALEAYLQIAPRQLQDAYRRCRAAANAPLASDAARLDAIDAWREEAERRLAPEAYAAVIDALRDRGLSARALRSEQADGLLAALGVAPPAPVGAFQGAPRAPPPGTRSAAVISGARSGSRAPPPPPAMPPRRSTVAAARSTPVVTSASPRVPAGATAVLEMRRVGDVSWRRFKTQSEAGRAFGIAQSEISHLVNNRSRAAGKSLMYEARRVAVAPRRRNASGHFVADAPPGRRRRRRAATGAEDTATEAAAPAPATPVAFLRAPPTQTAPEDRRFEPLDPAELPALGAASEDAQALYEAGTEEPLADARAKKKADDDDDDEDTDEFSGMKTRQLREAMHRRGVPRSSYDTPEDFRRKLRAHKAGDASPPRPGRGKRSGSPPRAGNNITGERKACEVRRVGGEWRRFASRSDAALAFKGALSRSDITKLINGDTCPTSTIKAKRLQFEARNVNEDGTVSQPTAVLNVSQPPGRPPKGKRWDTATGAWVQTQGPKPRAKGAPGGVRPGAVVDAAAEAFGEDFARGRSKVKFRGTVVERGTEDGHDSGRPALSEEEVGGPVWRVRYDDDGLVWATPERFLVVVEKSPLRSNSWTTAEENKLRGLVKELGNRWTEIADRLGTGRTPGAVDQHWKLMEGQGGESVTVPRRLCDRWTAAEERRLREMVAAAGHPEKRLGASGWADITARLGTQRSPSAVERHWQNMTEIPGQDRRRRGGDDDEWVEGAAKPKKRRGGDARQRQEEADAALARRLQAEEEDEEEGPAPVQRVWRRWTPAEERHLRDLVGQLGDDFEGISESLGTERSAWAVEQHWNLMNRDDWAPPPPPPPMPPRQVTAPPAHRLLTLTQAADVVSPSPMAPDSSDKPPRRLALPTQLPPRWAAIIASHGEDADTSWVDAMREELSCPICLDAVERAVQVPCGHVFCSDCLAINQSLGESRHDCPSCRTPFRSRGVTVADVARDTMRMLQRLVPGAAAAPAPAPTSPTSPTSYSDDAEDFEDDEIDDDGDEDVMEDDDGTA